MSVLIGLNGNQRFLGDRHDNLSGPNPPSQAVLAELEKLCGIAGDRVSVSWNPQDRVWEVWGWHPKHGWNPTDVLDRPPDMEHVRVLQEYFRYMESAAHEWWDIRKEATRKLRDKKDRAHADKMDYKRKEAERDLRRYREDVLKFLEARRVEKQKRIAKGEEHAAPIGKEPFLYNTTNIAAAEEVEVY